MQPRVTAILVVRNGEEWLDRTLPALAAQTRRPDDFVLVDAASSDGSAARLAAASPTRFVTAPALSFGAAVDARAARRSPPWSPRTSGSGCSPPTRRPSRTRSSGCSRPSRWRPRSRSPGPSSSIPTSARRCSRTARASRRLGETVRLVDGELDQAQHDADGDVLGVTLVGDARAPLGLDRARRIRPGPADDRCRARLLDPHPAGRAPRGPGRRAPASRAARVPRTTAAASRRPTGCASASRARRSCTAAWSTRRAARSSSTGSRSCPSPSCARSGTCSASGRRLIGGELASGFAAAFDGSVPAARRRLHRTRRIPWSAIAPLRVPSDELRERRAAQRERESGRPTSPSWCAHRSSRAVAPGSSWWPRSAGLGVFWRLLQAQVSARRGAAADRRATSRGSVDQPRRSGRARAPSI